MGSLSSKLRMPSKEQALPAAEEEDVAQAVNEAKQGRVEFRLDRLANIHVPIGKVSFEEGMLKDNVATFIDAINAARPR